MHACVCVCTGLPMWQRFIRLLAIGLFACQFIHRFAVAVVVDDESESGCGGYRSNLESRPELNCTHRNGGALIDEHEFCMSFLSCNFRASFIGLHFKIYVRAFP